MVDVALECLLRFEEVEAPEVDPATQKRTMASRRQNIAAHMKPKLYFPRSAILPAERKLRRPKTKAALAR